MTITSTRAHDGLDCPDAEALFRDTLTDNDHLRAEAARLRALTHDLDTKLTHVTEERDALAAQCKYLYDELAAAEHSTLPADTLTLAAIPNTEMVALYRRASRITRGPLPPTVVAEIHASTPEIQQAMTEAGTATLDRIVRRIVRRRRNRATRRR